MYSKTKRYIGIAAIFCLIICVACIFVSLSATSSAEADSDANSQSAINERAFGDLDAMTEEEIQAMNERGAQKLAEVRAKYQSEVRVNEYGQTYGSELAGDPNTGEGVPDLISVMASNGKDGYMYFSDVQKIYQRDFTVTPEELEITAPQKEEAIAKALNELITDKYGCELISTEELLEINKNRSSMGGAAAAYQEAQAKVVARVESNKDVNGKAIVEVTKRSNVNLKDEAISKLASNANIDAAGSAQKLLDQVTYDILYQQARDTTGVPIPVYLSDGRTLIGEYRMDSL